MNVQASCVVWICADMDEEINLLKQLFGGEELLVGY